MNEFDRNEAKWATVLGIIIVSLSAVTVLTFLGVLVWAIVRVVGAVT